MIANSTQTDGRLDVFEAYRPLLFSIAYRMLGSVSEAEDAVQETYVRFSAVALDRVRESRPFLTTVVTRICLDQLKSARVTREAYVGPWLPEPLVESMEATEPAPVDVAEDHESISMAFLVLLEALTPVERAVFLLREVFDYEYEEVGRIVGRSEPACRQIFRRAKQHIVSRRPRFDSTNEEHERLVRTFIRAAEDGEVDALTDLLAEDVIFWSDAGGKRPAALQPIRGADRVAKVMRAAIRKENLFEEQEVRIVTINGKPGILALRNGVVQAAVSFDAHQGRIHEIRLQLNPEKLNRLSRTFSAGS
ncbi:MAG: RNA polymerase sigma-70 factor [Dehalococcoidia bacterium]